MNRFESKCVVVPIDFGEESEEAVDVAMEVASDPGRVHAIYVAPDLGVIGPGVAMEVIDPQAQEKELRETFQQRFEAAKYREIHFSTAFGDPGHQIVHFAEEIGADLIVMPSHGRTGLTRLLIGSVAERVIRLAHCPVLVLRK